MDDGIDCIWCVSMQMGIIVAILWFFLRGNAIFDTAILALAFSAVAVILNQAFTKGGK